MSESSGISFRLRQSRPIRLDVDLACEAGELLALVGPSGSGKTTILRTLAGLYQPRQARVSCQGRVWADSGQGLFLPARQRPVGMVFQSYALFPHLTARANLMAAMSHLPPGQRVERARELLALVHLPDLDGRLPRQLSGGQQQRVAVARALARDPQVLLLDEPFSAVDRATRERLHLELAELRGKLKIPVILVTHDLDEAAQLADRIAIVHHGRVLQAGPPAEIRTKPRDLTVARLVNLSNLFRARVMGHEAGWTVLDWRGRRMRVPGGERFAVGAEVVWCIPTTAVDLAKGEPSSQAAGENRLQAELTAVTLLGEMARLTLTLPEGTGERIIVSLPLHRVQGLELTPGRRLAVSLPGGAIHLMPAPTAARMDGAAVRRRGRD